MDIGIISARYAKALLKLATEKGDTEEAYRGMSVLSDSFLSVPSLRPALENPVVDDGKKIEILGIAAGGTQSESLMQFFRLVVKNHRIAMIQFMAHSFIDSYRKKNRLIHSMLTVPVPLSSKTIDRLKAFVKEKTDNEVEFVVKVDSSIIGGFIMEYDTYCLDVSVRNRLRLMRDQLLSSNSVVAK